MVYLKKCHLQLRHPIFERQNLKLEVGNLYCFYGKNGAGKTTMLNLLCGLYIDEYQGEILYNDINIRC
nr:ATP-binding cassette domain-containing protein [uncultured Acetatifactor sp.]